jgi:hypothetical protein
VAKRRKRTKRSVQRGIQSRDLYLSEYEITSEPIEDDAYKRVPAAVKDVVEHLHEQAQTQPRAAIPELLQLIEQYPNVPMLYNYLSVAYSRAGERTKAEETTKKWRKFSITSLISNCFIRSARSFTSLSLPALWA